MNKSFSILTLFLLLACSGPVGMLGHPKTSHHDLVEKLTREAKFFGLEDVEYLTHVTYKSDELRKSYVEEYSKRFHLPADKEQEMLAQEMAEGAQYDEFVVSHFATNREGTKLTKDPKVWRLTLSTSEEKTSGKDPESVTTLASSHDPLLHYFYPHVGHWSSNYLVKFKKEDPAATLYLRMAGVSGDLLFKWTR